MTASNQPRPPAMPGTASGRTAYPRRAAASRIERPERADQDPGFIGRQLNRLASLGAVRAAGRRESGFVSAVMALAPALEAADEAGLDEILVDLRVRLRRGGLDDDGVVQCFALVREVARRVLGMAHLPTQLAGGWVILGGQIAEMATGEGKTLTATLPVATAALAGIPVHVVSANDYLTRRDAELMAPVYGRLGLSVGHVVGGMAPDERRRAYGQDITYCTNKELVFDYLKDRIVLARQRHALERHARVLSGTGAGDDRLLQRGLHFAVVDEADSVLIDEARTPLIISAPVPPNPTELEAMATAVTLAAGLREDSHFRVDRTRRRVVFTELGSEHLRQECAELGGLWAARLRREELVRLALESRLLYQRDSHYIVREGRIEIVDEHTGRVMPDRSWSQGLHQMIELKEACSPTAQNKTLARISFQRFFRRFLALGGMTGTAREVGGELFRTYGVGTVALSPYRPLIRRFEGSRVFADAEAQRQALLEAIRARHAAGQPVLVGSASVGDSESLSALLLRHALPHQLLNAKQDAAEAEIVSHAGETGAITIATSMAGRGTDIKLSDGARVAGGLHVILTSLHEAGRIDRQLVGRCARMGDPGSYEYILALPAGAHLQDGETSGISNIARLGKALARASDDTVTAGFLWLRMRQRREERHTAQARAELMAADAQLEDTMAFSGGMV